MSCIHSAYWSCHDLILENEMVWSNLVGGRGRRWGSGMMRRCNGVRDGDGGREQWRGHRRRRWGRRRGQGQGWWWQRCGVEGGGVEGGGGIEGGSAEVGQPDGAKPNFTTIRVLHRRGYSPYIRYIIGIGWRNSADTKNFIYGIDWCNTADTNNLLYRLAYARRYQQSWAYKYRPHTTILT
jgi:hypothetical protein